MGWSIDRIRPIPMSHCTFLSSDMVWHVSLREFRCNRISQNKGSKNVMSSGKRRSDVKSSADESVLDESINDSYWDRKSSDDKSDVSRIDSESTSQRTNVIAPEESMMTSWMCPRI
jgi:hypothetical protein